MTSGPRKIRCPDGHTTTMWRGYYSPHTTNPRKLDRCRWSDKRPDTVLAALHALRQKPKKTAPPKPTPHPGPNAFRSIFDHIPRSPYQPKPRYATKSHRAPPLPSTTRHRSHDA